MPIVKSVSTVEGEEVTLLVEVDTLPAEDSPYDDTRAGGVEIPEAARDLFADGLHLARTCAKQAVEGMNKLDQTFRPEEFEVKLAIKLDSEMGAFLAKVSAGAQMEVTMKWKPRGSMGGAAHP
ncbi:CU044_2847 family protein [Leptolyngbya boryana CZ1]|uniref:CU044_2847 family protein n=1 Tax=Leptolyngbya boryana CZ1 TaxID=3060204 RepID=A0AA97APW8_LEPBY|nr:CU044_2847 family protein [Leptolyngbya boryana]WNZ46132.1 CU044_2847 family protein [Leptolyngbya boryana CZ1]